MFPPAVDGSKMASAATCNGGVVADISLEASLCSMEAVMTAVLLAQVHVD